MRCSSLAMRALPRCLVVLSVITCTEDSRDDEVHTPLLITADPTENQESSIIRQRQERLLRALTDPDADPTPAMAAGFTIVDRAAAGIRSGVRRDLDGRYRVGWDRWQVLAKAAG